MPVAYLRKLRERDDRRKRRRGSSLWHFNRLIEMYRTADLQRGGVLGATTILMNYYREEFKKCLP